MCLGWAHFSGSVRKTERIFLTVYLWKEESVLQCFLVTALSAQLFPFLRVDENLQFGESAGSPRTEHNLTVKT